MSLGEPLNPPPTFIIKATGKIPKSGANGTELDDNYQLAVPQPGATGGATK